jgi:hypothetical protein
VTGGPGSGAAAGGRGRKGPEAIGDLLQGFLRTSKVGRDLARDALEALWREAVGPEIAASTRVRGFRGGVLTIEVASSALLQELSTFYGASILTSLKAQGGPFGEVREIAFRLGSFGVDGGGCP